MKSSTFVWIIVVILVLLGAWYWMSTSTPATTPATALGLEDSTDQTNTGAPIVTPTLAVAHDATLGDYLVASNGMTLYLYTKDKPGISNCTGTCAVNWPPYVHTTNEPLVASAAATGTIATLMRPDTGGAQLMYKNVPLYFWKDDTKPGDTTGQGVGGVWYVVKP
jgi:predicted lipoprotein with Yx(FWY)xxD motif